MGGKKVLKQSWSLWSRFRAQGNLKAWNVELERIWCVSNWTEGDTVGGVRTFRHYLSNVLWHVWGMGGKGIEMRDLCRRRCSFISFLQSEWLLRRAKKQADIQADSDHTANVCLSYLDIHSKHLNQVVLNGPHPLLIETQAVPDNLICLRNGGDINSTWLRQWPPSVVGIKPIQHFIIPSLSGESRRTVSLYLLFSAVPLLPPSLSLYPPAPMIRASR